MFVSLDFASVAGILRQLIDCKMCQINPQNGRLLFCASGTASGCMQTRN